MDLVAENPLGIEVEPVALSRGVQVKSVRKDGPGDKLGLREGDVLTHLDGQMLYNVNRFHELVSGLAHEKSVEIRVQRENETITFQFQRKDQ